MLRIRIQQRRNFKGKDGQSRVGGIWYDAMGWCCRSKLEVGWELKLPSWWSLVVNFGRCCPSHVARDKAATS